MVPGSAVLVQLRHLWSQLRHLWARHRQAPGRPSGRSVTVRYPPCAPGQRARDGQTQTDSTGGPRPRRVEPGEPLEHALPVRRCDPRAVVHEPERRRPRDRRGPRVPGHRHPNRTEPNRIGPDRPARPPAGRCRSGWPGPTPAGRRRHARRDSSGRTPRRRGRVRGHGSGPAPDGRARRGRRRRCPAPPHGRAGRCPAGTRRGGRRVGSRTIESAALSVRFRSVGDRRTLSALAAIPASGVRPGPGRCERHQPGRHAGRRRDECADRRPRARRTDG